jgi:large subunit ribosomal protein L25
LSVVSLNVEPRVEFGTRKIKGIRKNGFIPAVIYGEGQPATLLQMKSHELEVFVAALKGNPLIDLIIAGSKEPQKAILQKLQRHPVTRKIIHVDFHAVNLAKKIKLEIPLEFVGSAAGVKQGGILEPHMRSIKVETLPNNIPDFIKIDVSELKLGHSFHIRDLNLSDIEILDDPENVIASVVIPKAMKTAEVVEEKEEEEKETKEE